MVTKVIDLAKADLVSSMLSSHSFLVEEGDGIRRIKMEDVQRLLGQEILSPTYTLEGNSSPTFSITPGANAAMYRAHMGGYMMKVVGGKVYAAKLNPSDWNYFADGTKVDNPAKYETMVHVPPCNFKASGKTMQFGGLSPIAGGHTFDSPEWVGAYLGYVENDVLHSRPDVSPSHSNTMSAFDTYAKKLGTQWGQANYGFFCLINALSQATFGSLNVQKVVGAGWQHSNWEACRNVSMGLTRSLGDGTGSVLYNDATLGNQYPTKLFGFEDLWSKLWEFRPGIRFYMDGSQRYAVVYGGNQCSNTANGRKFAVPLLNAGGHTTKTMVLGEYWDMICNSFDAGSYGGDVYYCDGYWDAEGGQLLVVGSDAGGGLLCGLSYARSTFGFSGSGTYIGARLAFYGQPVLVSGSELVAK